MYDVIYNYFKDNYGCVNKSDENISEYRSKYKDFTNNQLKNKLKHLKKSNSSICEIQYVSKLLREKIKTAPPRKDSENHDNMISQSFWHYVKKYVKKPTLTLPEFNLKTCSDYFIDVLKAKMANKTFEIPEWIPKLSEPSIPFDMTPPTYAEITKTIKQMKSSGSPCPLDKISVILFKRCPYLRSYLTKVIQLAWETKSIPDTWKRACTILIYKKGDPKDPSNFRPITLESIPLKVFTACLRNCIFKYLVSNNFIEHNIQKGFIPKISGAIEHTAQMAES